MRPRPTVNFEELRTRLANAIPPQHHGTAAAVGRMLIATFATDGGAASTVQPTPSAASPEPASPEPASPTPNAATPNATTPNAATPNAATPNDVAASAPLPPRIERFLGALLEEMERVGVTPRKRPRSDIPLVNMRIWPPDLDDV